MNNLKSTSNQFITLEGCSVRVGEIEQENIYLNNSLNLLHETSLRLRERLHSVLRESNEANKECETTRVMLCPAADTIRGHRDSADDSIRILEDAINRLEV